MLLCCKTYNIHDSQDVLLDVSATMVAHHHLVGYHQRLNVALTANWALQRQLATANMVGRRLQSSLPPRCAFHRLLIWGRLRTFRFWRRARKSTKAQQQPIIHWKQNHLTVHSTFVRTGQQMIIWNIFINWKMPEHSMNIEQGQHAFMNILMLLQQRPVAQTQSHPITTGNSDTTTILCCWLLCK